MAVKADLDKPKRACYNILMGTTVTRSLFEMEIPMEKAYKPYPEHVSIRCGCKVSWLTYKDLKAAEAAAEAAKYNADIQWSLGYDFGYMTPGSIETKPDGTYEVCIP